MGFTCDLTFWKDHSTLHFGIEDNEIIGLDIGPTLFYSNGNINAGISVIPFAGIFLFGYYELAWPFFQTPYQSWGGYLKLPFGFQLYGGDYNS